MLARVWVLWAIALAFSSSVATVRLVRLRRRLTVDLEALLTMDDGVHELQQLPPAAAPTPAPATRRLTFVGMSRVSFVGTPRAVPKPLAVNVRATLISLCALLEGTLGWITGCAATDAFSALWIWLQYYPSFPVLTANLGAVLLVTALAVLWLLFVADDPFQYNDEQKGRRSNMERYFITNAMSFFVGWTYVVVLRDVVVLVSVLLRELFNNGTTSDDYSFVGELAVVVFSGPFLTVVLMLTKNWLLTRYSLLGTARDKVDGGGEDGGRGGEGGGRGGEDGGRGGEVSGEGQGSAIVSVLVSANTAVQARWRNAVRAIEATRRQEEDAASMLVVVSPVASVKSGKTDGLSLRASLRASLRGERPEAVLLEHGPRES